MMRIFGILGEVMDDHARAYELMKKGRETYAVFGMIAFRILVHFRKPPPVTFTRLSDA